jgi:glyoxylase-like metal-dependent hydrolase (beta-lactamase superfamily II)/8-oxo-dGTP pyrophosphatase MutT (NUDIX family)
MNVSPSQSSPLPSKSAEGSKIPQAASVLLARGRGSAEVFVVTRAAALRFLGGFLAFPGGKVHSSDHELARATPGLTGQHVAAVRELFEEIGVLLAHDDSGAYPTAEQLAPLRRDLLAEQMTFNDLLAEQKLHLRPDDLTFAGSLVTPAFSPYRFDTAFFVAELPPGQTAEVWPGELTEGAWHSAERVLADWIAGDNAVSPPTVALLQAIRGRPIEELPLRVRPLLDELATGAIHPIWFNPGVQMIPLFTEGLPPSTHTNAYLIGDDPAYLLDPGASAADEQARLFDILDRRQLRGVVLTHHHRDHIGAATVCAQRYRVPILSHPWTAEALRGRIDVQQLLHDGDRLDLGTAPDGKGGWHLQALHTPGHAPGHLAFWEPRYRLLFVGDLISTLSSVLIPPPPQGDLALYLDSLRHLQTLPARLLLPAHGSPSARPGFVLEQALIHRRQREEQLLQALAAAPRTVLELALELYRGLPADLMRFAEMQIRANLHKLQSEGRAAPYTAGGELWRYTP